MKKPKSLKLSIVGSYAVLAAILCAIVQAQTNLLNPSSNPGFELGTSAWAMGAGTVTNTNPGEAAKSAVLPASTGTTENIMKMNTYVPVTPGNLYHLSALVKHNIAGDGAMFGVRNVSAQTNTIRYSWQTIATNALWQRYDMTFLPAADAASLQVYCKTGIAISGTASWDGFRLDTRTDPFTNDATAFFQMAELATVVIDLENGNFSPGTLSPRVKCEAEMVGGTINWKIVRETDGVNGTPIVEKTYAVTQAGAYTWTIDLAPLPEEPGRYFLSVTASGPEDLLRQTIIKPLAIKLKTTLPAPANVATTSAIDTKGRLTVNGQPFQSVCYYHVPVTNFAAGRALGATTAYFTRGTIPYLVQSVDDAWAAGLYSWVLLGQPPFFDTTTRSWNTQKIQELITALEGHKGVIGYYLMDEPDRETFSGTNAVQNIYNWVKTADANRHVVYVNLSSSANFAAFGSSTDMASYCSYPFPDATGLDKIRARNASIKQGIPNRPLISVQQTFGDGGGVGYPTLAQIRANLYTSICDGMVHAHYYSFDDPPPSDMLANHPEMKSYTTLLNDELRRLQPFLYANGAVAVAANSLDPDVRAFAKRDPNNSTKVILVLVNQTASPITMPGVELTNYPIYATEAFFEGTLAGTASDRKLAVTLPAYGVGVYRLTAY